MYMNRGFRDAAKAFLPNAKIIICRFHVVRYCTEAMENVRRGFQKNSSKAQRRHFKSQGGCHSPISTNLCRRSLSKGSFTTS